MLAFGPLAAAMVPLVGAWAGPAPMLASSRTSVALSAAISPAAPVRPAPVREPGAVHASRPMPGDPLHTAQTLLRMSRPNTLPQSVALVAIGAFAADRSLSFMANPAMRMQLGVVAVLVVLTTAASMLVNDYWDFVTGVDTAESQAGRPLVEGSIAPATVKAACKWLYAVHLGFLLMLSSPALRLCVYLNTMATLLYTRHIKPLPVAKNVLCAGVIATTVALGAIVVRGSFGEGVRAVWPVATLVGCGILHREIVMDVDDVDGDRAAGVRTLPVLLGGPAALVAACVPLVAAITAHSWVLRSPPIVSAPLAALASWSLWTAHKMSGQRGGDAVREEALNQHVHRMLGAHVETAPVFLLASILAFLRVSGC